MKNVADGIFLQDVHIIRKKLILLRGFNPVRHMFKGIATVALLVLSNAFMTLAWYGHIAFKSKLERFGILAIVLLSWGIALFEYCFQVPANRIGSSQFGGPFSIWELKVIQEVVSLSVFTLFALVFMKSDFPALEPPRRFPLPDTGGLLHLPEIAAPAAGRAAKPDRRYLPTKSIRILPARVSRLRLLFPPVMAVNLIRVHEVLPEIIYSHLYLSVY